MKIVVTGAGGFIGAVVASTLAGEPDLVVHGGTRDGRDLGPLVAPCRLDVCDEASMAAALKCADMVVHCAVGDRRTTVEGTGALLRTARAVGVRRAVHISSIAVYGQAEGDVREDTTLVSPSGRGYAHWKVAAELLCRDAVSAGLEVVMLRPAIVYGPGSDLWVSRPARRVVSPDWGPLGDIGRGTCNLVHVRDVAAACLAAIRADTVTDCPAFNISDHGNLTWDAWYARLAQALGCPTLREISPLAWRRTIAALPFKALAKLRPGAARLFERFTSLAPAPSELTLFGLVAQYPTDRVASRLGWRPQVTLGQGVAESVAWLRSVGVGQ